MILTLELTPEQEAKLKDKAHAVGVEPAEYVISLLDEPNLGETTGERLRRLGILGGASGKPRPDGRAWSEVEGFE